MIALEQVEKLCERANISYDEAKKVLEATNGDLLEAIIKLENEGRIKAPSGGGYYSSQTKKDNDTEAPKNESYDYYNQKSDGATFKELLGKFFRWCGKIIHKGNINTFEVSKNGGSIVTIPVTVLVLLLIFAFWIAVPLIIIGLFFGYRYVFRGPDLENTPVNRAVDSVTRAAENLKNEVKEQKGEGHNGENSNN